MEIKYLLTDDKNLDFQNLINKLEKYYISLNKDLALQYQDINKITKKHYVCIAYYNEIAIACGSFKIYDENTVEMKKFYVLSEYQNQGIGSNILKKLENHAKSLGYNKVLLETGCILPKAISFYKKRNYKIIENFDEFKDDENIVCMKKELK
ncbi:GNAT family N-acetyltransferase [Methanobrevibacter sp. DSM 116169]|uniref:GNAT family N-acetyltransferase n=1 Tax=Methanobrevibacter sp. DSM 116169 TaxID=3242727 RepID=UPI0038FD2B42